jgi:CheY-like chemotaxis protein
MGGTITAESEKSVGSEFRFTIDVGIGVDPHGAVPEPAPEASVEEPDPEPAAPSDPKALHVLAAEDNPKVSGILAQILMASGCVVEVVANGQLAVEAVKRRDTPFDVILMDLEMPVLNGIDAAREIRSLEDREVSQVPIIALTGHATEYHREHSLEAGMDVFMSKPVDFAKLTQTIRELAGARPSS